MSQSIVSTSTHTLSSLEKYCPCSRSNPLDINLPILRQFALTSIEDINNVKLKSHKHLCLPLTLKQIIRAEVEELPKAKPSKSSTTANFTHSYTVLFEVSPSDGIFESRLLYNEQTKLVQLHSDILRVNLYGQSSACIQDKYQLRSFCYCTSYHKKLKTSQTSAASAPYTSKSAVNNGTVALEN